MFHASRTPPITKKEHLIDPDQCSGRGIPKSVSGRLYSTPFFEVIASRLLLTPLYMCSVKAPMRPTCALSIPILSLHKRTYSSIVGALTYKTTRLPEHIRLILYCSVRTKVSKRVADENHATAPYDSLRLIRKLEDG
ncbi:MAG: hypothetical protein C5S48_06810 [Candidatus Methanogaster sp.]|nr:MAG: hypothetical protein C5S48_06810 [ANME-2 cluster archaeon]